MVTYATEQDLARRPDEDYHAWVERLHVTKLRERAEGDVRVGRDASAAAAAFRRYHVGSLVSEWVCPISRVSDPRESTLAIR